MPPFLYREAHLGIRIRLEELAMRVRELESQLTEAFWSSRKRWFFKPHNIISDCRCSRRY